MEPSQTKPEPDQLAHCPRLRPLRIQPHPEAGPQHYALIDPAGISPAVISLSLPALQLATLLTGEYSLQELPAEAARRFGFFAGVNTFRELISQLDQVLMLEGPRFEEHYQSLVTAYRQLPARTMRSIDSLGLPGTISRETLEDFFSLNPIAANVSTTIRGLIAPHLDYRRGLHQYQSAYSALAGHDEIRRFIVLGTNHSGRALSPVATVLPFETPVGTTLVDHEFIFKLEECCGYNLRRYELDHASEHSIELQVLILQSLFGPEEFTIVPILCPDICGPTGTGPLSGEGVDLRDLAVYLRDMLAEDDAPTCIIAGADFSHVGGYFGDRLALSPSLLKMIEQQDRCLLDAVIHGSPEDFQAAVSVDSNPTRVCSSGSIYTIMTALQGSQVRLLGYGQAVDEQSQCCVSCAAVVFESK